MYWWALGIGIIVLGISLYLGKKKGLLNQPPNRATDFIGSPFDKKEHMMDKNEDRI